MTASGAELQSEVIVLDIRELVLDKAYNRGLDPADLEVVESKTTDDHELSVLVESRSLHTGGDRSMEKSDDV